uniref:DUF538 domain-containing protein n=1 Tax=Araucaria cunninghamii TaxID=56994 RepID=A0A0D6R2U9_ARACU
MSTKLFLLFPFLLILLQCSAEESNRILRTAHEELSSKGFPSGLLPNSVANYSLEKSSGDFSVQLKGRCDIVLPPDNYLASFSRVITGKLTEGYIQGLTGIRVYAFFKWWSVTGIRSKGEKLVFEVGMVSASYPSANFDESPACEGGKHSSS